jgi:2-dehydro-3-deoxyphosphogluconate aldolase/(4S)-4-hydroxy-2-oxoglutarate aldolase
MARAAAAGGIRLIEITWNSDQPASLIQQLRTELPHCWIGAGTLLTIAQVETAIAAGSQFLFTPHTAPDLIQVANRHHCPIVPGALSPSEIVTAWQAGASSVKVFPIQSVGGADYIRSLQAPLSGIPLVPTGGVTIANAVEFLQAGAIGVGLSGDLFPKSAIQNGNWEHITQQAAILVKQLATYRSEFQESHFARA